MRTVLVCVRTPLAAQAVASCAARLGLGAFRTAASEAEVMARLAERPAELILVDVHLSRPDTVGFTQRVLALAPSATLVLFGAVEPQVATAAVAAGARGLIRGDSDPVSTVAKALLLIGSPRRPAGPPTSPPPVGAAAALRAAEPEDAAARELGRPGRASAGRAAAGAEAGTGATVVPAQRGDAAAAGEPGPARRGTLTERELQVLRGMAEGKSNAEIGRDLYVSEDTVKTHARRLFRKLGARDRAHAVAVGFRSGALG